MNQESNSNISRRSFLSLATAATVSIVPRHVLGDIGCHKFSTVFKALNLGSPTKIEARSFSDHADDSVKLETARLPPSSATPDVYLSPPYREGWSL